MKHLIHPSLLRLAIARCLRICGALAFAPAVVDVLADVFERYMCRLVRPCMILAETAGRTCVAAPDVFVSLSLLDIDPNDLLSFAQSGWCFPVEPLLSNFSLVAPSAPKKMTPRFQIPPQLGFNTQNKTHPLITNDFLTNSLFSLQDSTENIDLLRDFALDSSFKLKSPISLENSAKYSSELDELALLACGYPLRISGDMIHDYVLSEEFRTNRSSYIYVIPEPDARLSFNFPRPKITYDVGPRPSHILPHFPELVQLPESTNNQPSPVQPICEKKPKEIPNPSPKTQGPKKHLLDLFDSTIDAPQDCVLLNNKKRKIERNLQVENSLKSAIRYSLGQSTQPFIAADESANLPTDSETTNRQTDLETKELSQVETSALFDSCAAKESLKTLKMMHLGSIALTTDGEALFSLRPNSYGGLYPLLQTIANIPDDTIKIGRKTEEIRCICRNPKSDDGSFMVSCDLCSVWFHGNCVGVTEGSVKSGEQWHCSRCKT